MKPGIEPVLKAGGDLERSAVEANVRDNVRRLQSGGPILADLTERDELRVVGGVYDLATGKVDLV